ncbi:hypothetical protein PybrP1_000321 [[Pythium] brassicae (nom. inval.)]|nr:hypothetical protein PybrP1_000321 [[Pythium] brassicae (nom. inval.)]
MAAPAVGMRNGRLELFYASDTPPRLADSQERARVQVLGGGLRHSLLPLGEALLRDAGVGRGGAFVLVLDNDRAGAACLLAAMTLECVCVLLSKSRAALVPRVRRETGLTTVLVVDDVAGTVRKLEGEARQRDAPAWLREPEVAAAGGCVGMLTSGSIGEPKVVVCTWAKMCLQGRVTHEQLFPAAPARVVCATSITHAYAINALFALFTSPFDAASELCFAPTIGGLHALLAEPKDKFTLLYGTPATYTALLDLPAALLNVDVPYCAGTRMQVELFTNVAAHCGLHVMQNYGSTETGDIAAWHLHGKRFRDEAHEMAREDRQRIYVGSLWPGVRAAVAPETGEVLVSTPWQALGYVRDCALDAFHGAPHRTADIGRVARDARGTECLWLQERLRPSVEVVCNGVATPHPPRLIEAAAASHPDVTDALVLAQPRSAAAPVRLRAVPRDASSVRAEDIVEWCARQLPALREYLALEIELVDYLPCSAAGKLMYT